MNRIDRLSAILIQLQSKKVIRAQEIADRFDISLRTVYRDIRALEEAGIPIGSEAGIGYFLAEGFHLPPVMFTKNEAGSLLLAEKLVEKMTDSSVDQNFKSAMFKIKSVLNSGDKDYLDNLDTFINVSYYIPKVSADFPNNFISDIQNAIASKNIISIEYMSASKNEITTRNIEPVGICFYGSKWHLIGFCTLRNDYRDFRVDRIKSLINTGNYFLKQKKKSINEYFKLLADKVQLEKVVVKFNDKIIKKLEQQRYYFGFVEEIKSGNYTVMTFLVTPLEYIAGWLLSHGDNVEIIHPAELRDIVNKMVEKLYSHYCNRTMYEMKH